MIAQESDWIEESMLSLLLLLLLFRIGKQCLGEWDPEDVLEKRNWWVCFHILRVFTWIFSTHSLRLGSAVTFSRKTSLPSPEWVVPSSVLPWEPVNIASHMLPYFITVCYIHDFHLKIMTMFHILLFSGAKHSAWHIRHRINI